MQPLIQIVQGVARHPGFRLPHPVDLTIGRGEHTALVGPNGGGKSLVAEMMTGALPLLGTGVRYAPPADGRPRRFHERIRIIKFRGVYGSAEPAYYRQRWNHFDEQAFPTVAELLGPPSPEEAALRSALGVDLHADKAVNLLSSGELRRLQLAQALKDAPELLLIDNPFIGLDEASRRTVGRLLEELSRRVTLVFLVSRTADIPPFVRSGCWVEQGRVGEREPREVLERRERERTAALCGPGLALADLPLRGARADGEAMPAEAGDVVVKMDHIDIAYGQRTLFRDFSWEVRSGERWALLGPNGSGKSTLLSLVCADNPQGYALPLTLFGRRRGSGESIWDIKRRIGYVSPEMSATYRKQLPALDIVASGLFDTVGLYRRPSAAQREACRAWLDVFGGGHPAERDFLRLSSGEQRLVLLVRAFVKEPDLLILDEPFHGLDEPARQRALQVIEAYLQNPAKTLIVVTHYPEVLRRGNATLYNKVLQLSPRSAQQIPTSHS